MEIKGIGMASLRSEVLSLFDDVGWTSANCWVRYSVISNVLNNKLKLKDEGLHRASAIERAVRLLRQEGYFERRVIDGEVQFKKLKGGVSCV